jgi:NAD(P)-dependent dehydrogenase (short-subunit alcohol dehydrogenase family)
MAKLDGKIALVTGSSRSIGKAIAIALAKEGARLVLAARTVAGLESTAAAVKAAGSEALVVPTDVREEAQIENLFKKTMERFGRLDILVNNAGIFDTTPLAETSTETWDNIISTHLRAAFLCSRAAFRIMKAQGGGRIINIGSISALRVRENNAPYNTAKAAMVGLTQSVALEGRDFNINCGILHPGLVRRDIPFPGEEAQPIMEPEEIAAAAVYMACQPDHVNVLELVQLPREQPYLGRG